MKVNLFRSATGSSRHKPGQSIRGKISNPIPISSSVDEEFPMRNPEPAVVASHVPDDGEPPSQHLPPSPQPRYPTAASSSSLSHSGHAPVPENMSQVAHSKNSGSNNSLSASVSPAGPSGPSPVSDSARSSPQRRTNQSSQLRYSAISASTRGTGDMSNVDFPQRKKSTLRDALHKLFGRKKKGRSQGPAETEPSPGPSVQGRSDPSPDFHRLGYRGEAKRSASLPITEYDRALRSHSIAAEDITAIESARNSLHTDFNFARRRATAVSIQLHSPMRPRDGEFNGLSPRPASTNARSAGILNDPGEIGRAITSDLAGLRRRSRSLTGLEDIGGARYRRRSDEIRYWRGSYGQGLLSPLSSTAPEGDDPDAVAVDLPADAASAERAKSPPQPFHFGSLATMNEMAGMKITHAAGLEKSLVDLEARMRRMEGVVSRLHNESPTLGTQAFGREPAPPAPTASDATLAYTGNIISSDSSLGRPESQGEGTSDVYSNSHHSEEMRSSFGEAPILVGSLQPPPGTHHPSAGRPTSNTTIRGAAAISALPSGVVGPLTVDHYTTLLALIETERATRRGLEGQVRRLTHAVYVLSKQTGHDVQLDPPPTARSFGGQSAFDDDTTDEENDDSERDTLRRTSARLEDSEISPSLGDADDDNLSDTFVASREEGTFGFGAFGEELRDDEDENRKKAARTLSLSQLTVGKGQQLV